MDPLLARAAILLVFIGLLHGAAAALYIYWSVWWFDLLMHFLGGFWVGLVALWMYHRPEVKKNFPKLDRPLAAVLATAVLVGVVWEVFEYFTGLTYVSQGYASDVASDLVMDIVGAFAAYAYAKRLLKR